MMNLDNFGIATGRVSTAVKIFTNKNRSRAIRFTIAVPNNYTNPDGSRSSQFLPFTDFIPANAKSNGIYDNLEVGDRVSVSYSINNNNYTDADGIQHYELSLRVDNIKYAETRAAKEARLAESAA